MGKNSKRSKSYYIGNPKRKKKGMLNEAMKGFLCTYNGEREGCIKEVLNLLNEFADKLHGNKSQDLNIKSGPSKCSEIEQNNSESDVDVEEMLMKKECTVLDTKQRFNKVTVPVKNCIFISTKLENPVDLSLAIMNDIKENKKAKTKCLVRLIPVQYIVKSKMNLIESCCEELIFKYLPKRKISYYISYKSRNNKDIDRNALFKSICEFVNVFNEEAIADFKSPDFVINIDILGNMSCLSIIPEYMTKYQKCNIIKIAESHCKDSKSYSQSTIDIVDSRADPEPKADAENSVVNKHHFSTEAETNRDVFS